MRRHGVTRFLYQAGGLSAPPGRSLPLPLRTIRHTVARGYTGQHEDNEAVMRYRRPRVGTGVAPGRDPLRHGAVGWTPGGVPF